MSSACKHQKGSFDQPCESGGEQWHEDPTKLARHGGACNVSPSGGRCRAAIPFTFPSQRQVEKASGCTRRANTIGSRILPSSPPCPLCAVTRRYPRSRLPNTPKSHET